MDASKDDEIEEVGVDGYVEFEFDLPSALLSRLVDIFDEVGAAPLTSEFTASVPDEQGVYQLFFGNRLVYVGKTDGDAGLRSRLTRHSTKILERQNLDPQQVAFKAVRIFVFTAMDLEGDLIRHYGGVKNLAWNGSGFGSNDPGKERDTTKVKSDNFDYLFPIDIDRARDFEIAEGESASEVLSRLKNSIPYTLRYQNDGGRSRRAHRDLESVSLAGSSRALSVRQSLEHIADHLPKGWQIVALPGYIIMYKNDKRAYPSGVVIAQSS